MDERPFPKLNIDSPDFLDALSGRSKCPKCDKSRKYYCYTCFVPMSEIANKIPKVKLPVNIDIIKHPNEVDGKSTSAHAAVLAPDNVCVYSYPCIPDYDKSKTVLVFPGENSVSLEDLARVLSKDSSSIGGHRKTASDDEKESDASDEPPKKAQRLEKLDLEKSCKNYKTPFEKVVFIDSTWSQSKKIFLDSRLLGLKQIELKSQITKFWRYQRDKPNTYLATIEAVYYFLCEYHKYFVNDNYQGEYDNMLFFFNFMYSKIRHVYEGGDDLKAFGGKGKKKDAS